MWRAAFIGVGVALLCILPPIIHFITGPLSPAIGGFVGGMQLPGRRPSTTAIAGMAAIMTVVLTIIITIFAAIGLAVAAIIGDEERTFESGILVLVAFLVAIYVFGFAMIGGLLGTSFRNKQAAKQSREAALHRIKQSTGRPNGGASRTQ